LRKIKKTETKTSGADSSYILSMNVKENIYRLSLSNCKRLLNEQPGISNNVDLGVKCLRYNKCSWNYKT